MEHVRAVVSLVRSPWSGATARHFASIVPHARCKNASHYGWKATTGAAAGFMENLLISFFGLALLMVQAHFAQAKPH